MMRAAGAGVRPWIGSAVLHVALVVVLALAAVRWRSDPPPPQLAIEGSVVRYEDLPSSVKSGKPLREPTPKPRPQPAPVPPQVEPQPEPEPLPEPDVDAAAAAAREREEAAAARAEAKAATERKREAQAAEQAQAAEKKARAAAASAEKQRLQAAEAKKQQEQQEAARQKQQDEAAARAAKARAEQEARLQRELADEEAGEAVAQSGVVDEYRALLIQAIQRNWIRPPSARAGLECTLHVTQAAGGSVLDVKVGACNGDQAVRESVANAVYRASPLPPPRDSRAFQRNLVIVFKPTE